MPSVLENDTRSELGPNRALSWLLQQPTQWVKECNLCGSLLRNYYRLLSTTEQFGLSYSTIMCNRCSLVQLNPRLTKDAYEEFYQKGYYRILVYGMTLNSPTLDARSTQRYRDALKRGFGDLFERQRQATVLDVGGSGAGIMGPLGRDYDYSVTVLDPAKGDTQKANEYGVTVINAMIEDSEISQEYEVVTLVQTIEHLWDIGLTLRKIREAIVEDGLLLVDINDFAAHYQVKQRVSHCFKVDHVYCLTDRTIRMYLRRAGFAVIREVKTKEWRKRCYACKPCEPEPEYLDDAKETEEAIQALLSLQGKAERRLDGFDGRV